MSHLQITPLTGHTGAEILDIDLSRPVTGEAADAILAALDKYQVVFFPPHPVDEGNILRNLAEAIGTPVAPIASAPSAPGTDILELVNYPVTWHADITFQSQPPGEQVFQVVELPPFGGDTLWASTEAAYASLHPAIKRAVEGLTAIHDDHKIYRQLHPRPEVTWTEHPVVRIHPRSGRPSLFVNPLYTSHIVGLSDVESRHLLDLLFAHITAQEHVVRYRWHPGSIAIWDNRTTWHYAVGDYGGSQRRVRRVSTVGERPTNYY